MEGTTRSNLPNFVQCVDDMSASLINATTFAEERISLHSADVVASAVVVRLSGRSRQTRDLTAKSFGLKWAFKQMAVSAKSRGKAGLVVKDPKSCPEVFTCAPVRSHALRIRL